MIDLLAKATSSGEDNQKEKSQKNHEKAVMKRLEYDHYVSNFNILNWFVVQSKRLNKQEKAEAKKPPTTEKVFQMAVISNGKINVLPYKFTYNGARYIIYYLNANDTLLSSVSKLETDSIENADEWLVTVYYLRYFLSELAIDFEEAKNLIGIYSPSDVEASRLAEALNGNKGTNKKKRANRNSPYYYNGGGIKIFDGAEENEKYNMISEIECFTDSEGAAVFGNVCHVSD